MFRPKRRTTLLGGAAILLLPFAPPATRRPLSPVPAEPADGLFDAALQFIARRYALQGQRVVYNPVSLLQREFLLGYGKAIDIACEMERRNIWVIAHGPHGRFATIDADGIGKATA